MRLYEREHAMLPVPCILIADMHASSIPRKVNILFVVSFALEIE